MDWVTPQIASHFKKTDMNKYINKYVSDKVRSCSLSEHSQFRTLRLQQHILEKLDMSTNNQASVWLNRSVYSHTNCSVLTVLSYNPTSLMDCLQNSDYFLLILFSPRTSSKPFTDRCSAQNCVMTFLEALCQISVPKSPTQIQIWPKFLGT